MFIQFYSRKFMKNNSNSGSPFELLNIIFLIKILIKEVDDLTFP